MSPSCPAFPLPPPFPFVRVKISTRPTPPKALPPICMDSLPLSTRARARQAKAKEGSWLERERNLLRAKLHPHRAHGLAALPPDGAAVLLERLEHARCEVVDRGKDCRRRDRCVAVGRRVAGFWGWRCGRRAGGAGDGPEERPGDRRVEQRVLVVRRQVEPAEDVVEPLGQGGDLLGVEAQVGARATSAPSAWTAREGAAAGRARTSG